MALAARTCPALRSLVRTRRSWLWLAGVLLLALAAIAGLLWSQRVALVEGLALRALTARGVPAGLHVTRIDLDGLELAKLRIGAAESPDLRVERAAFAWSWRSLRERRLDHVELGGVRLHARLGEAGLELGALDPLLAGQGAAAPPPLPLAEAHFRDVEVAIESARGPLVLRAEGHVATLDPHSRAVEGAAEVTGATPFGSGSLSLRLRGTLDAPRVEFSGQATPDGRAIGVRLAEPLSLKGDAGLDGAGALAANAKLEAKRIELPALARLSKFAVDLKLAGNTLEAGLRVAKLEELSKPALVAPLGVEAKLTGSLEQLAFRGEASTGADGFALSFDGTLEPLAQRAAIFVRVPETDLAPKTRQPARLFPWLEGSVLRAKGRAAGEAKVTYADGKLSARAQLALRDVDLRTEYATLRRLNGVVTLLGPEPLVTPPGQTLSVALIEGALPLSNGVVRFELLRAETLRIEEGNFQLAGGTLSFSGSLPLEAEERRLVLTAKRLSVEQILAAMNFEGLSGTGFLDGTLPVEQRGRQVRIAHGELRTSEPGVIRYAAGAGAAAVAAGQPQLGPVLGALEDLRYETLTLEVSGDASEQLDVKVHARGNNPNFQQGRPVVLNVNVEAPVESLLRAGLIAYRVPEEIEGQVNRFFDRGKK